MEFGHTIFDNLCEEYQYPIKHRARWEEELFRLFSILKLDYYGYRTDGGSTNNWASFENDVFWVMPYYSGDCTCGWDFIDHGHESVFSLRHRDDCIYHKINALPSHLWGNEQYLTLLRPIYEEYNLDTTKENWWYGCGLMCTCDYYERGLQIYEAYVEEFGHKGHKPDCLLLRDNFHYKKSGFGIQWYKYPLRSANMNFPITLEKFRLIIDDCIRSLN